MSARNVVQFIADSQENIFNCMGSHLNVDTFFFVVVFLNFGRFAKYLSL